MDSAFFQTLVANGRFAEAAALLQASRAIIDPNELVASPAAIPTIVKLALEGGPTGTVAVIEAMNRANRGASIGTCAEVVAAIHRAAGRHFMTLLGKHDVQALEGPFRVMCSLPLASEHQRIAVRACYAAVLDRAEAKQAVILERVRRLTLRQIVAGSERRTIVATVGSDKPLAVLGELLVIAGCADAFPELGDELLHQTLCKAQWPIVACLERELEIVFHPTLLRWFLDPKSRTGFSEVARNWLYISLCVSGEDHAAEPPGSFDE